MTDKPKTEGIEWVLTLVLASFLTLVTVVPLLAFVRLAETNELAVVIIVFAAWLLVLGMVAPVVQRRSRDQEPEQVP